MARVFSIKLDEAFTTHRQGAVREEVRATEAALHRASRCYEPECLTLPETHLPNAFDLFLFVPYLALKAAGSAWRSVQQSLAAFTVAFTCAEAAALAFCDTQFPKALACFLPVPY